MGLLDTLAEEHHESNVLVWVKNLIVILLWIPPLMLLWAVGIAALGVGYRLALHGDLPQVEGILQTLDSDIMLLAFAGAIGYLYLVLANVTFGERVMTTATEQAEGLQEASDE